MKKAVLVSGCSGKMGQMICSAVNASDDMFVLYGFDQSGICPDGFDFPVFRQMKDIKEGADIVIDFSSAEGAQKALSYAFANNIPVVIGSTGLSNAHLAAISEASKEIPVFQSYNMSLTISLLCVIIKYLTERLPFDTDIEIGEFHHRGKKDSPSGTAFMLADVVNEARGNTMENKYGRTGLRKENEIGLSAMRGGSIAGKHTVLFARDSEEIDITHTAYSREIFAEGAVNAARFLLQQSEGFYTMEDLIQSYVIKSS